MKSLKITLLLAVFVLCISGQSFEVTSADDKLETVQEKKNDGTLQYLAVEKVHKKPGQANQA